MIKKTFVLGLLVAVIMSCNIDVFASSEGTLNEAETGIENELANEENSRAINYYKVAFSKTSDTKAKARVSAVATVSATEITSSITLQKYNSSTGKYVNKETSTKEVSGNTITHEKTFTVTSSGKYRIKVVLNDGSTTQIKYKELS